MGSLVSDHQQRKMPRTKRSASQSRKGDFMSEHEEDEEEDHLHDDDNRSKRQRSKERQDDEIQQRRSKSAEATEKPHVSFSMMIREAIVNSKDKRLLLNEIYDAIAINYPFFQNAGEGWKNSIRHNLSINPIFIKVPKEVVEAAELSSSDKIEQAEIDFAKGSFKPKKGCYWMVRDLTDLPSSRRFWMYQDRRRKSNPSFSYSRNMYQYRSRSADQDVIHIVPFTPVPTIMDVGRRYSDSFLQSQQGAMIIPAPVQEMRGQSLKTQTNKLHNERAKSIYYYPGSQDNPFIEIQPLPIEEEVTSEMAWYANTSPRMSEAEVKSKDVLFTIQEDDESEKKRRATMGPQILPRRPIKDVWLSGNPGFNL